ncbi:MAG TPA: hypothetical protein VER33_07735 [Polyangiaceae bacterium]|nr:hypothetical protein [Polyangiaceae bacterium]
MKRGMVDRSRWLWVLGVPLLAACGAVEDEPVSGTQLALTAQENTERALRGAHGAGSFIADSAALATLFSSAGEPDCAPVAVPPCAPGAICPAVEPPECDAEAVSVEDLQASRDDVNQAIDDAVQWLREEIFTPANLESEDGASATYLLGPDTLCPPGEDGIDAPGATPAPVAAPDPDCVAQAERLQVRLRLSSPSDGDVDVALLLTAQKRNPATLQLHRDRVGVTVDLGELKSALDALDEELEGVASMSGKLQLQLRRNGERDYSVLFNVLDALNVALVDDDNQQITVSLAASAPAAELRMDGNARLVTGSYDYGAFSVKGPLNAFRSSFDDDEALEPGGNTLPPKTYTGMIDLFLAGLEGKVVLDGNTDRLNLTGLGLGDASSTLKHDGQLLAQLDLNASAGRHFDLNVQKEDNDEATLTLSPSFDLSLLFNFAPLATQITDLPAYALNDRVRISLEGASPSLRTQADQVRVLSGTLNMTSSAVPQANVQVVAGSCLFESDGESPTHELLGIYSAGACR